MPEDTPEIDAYEHVLLDADRLIHGPRAKTYRHPLDDFSDTADYWTIWGHARGLLVPEAAYTPEDVAMMLVQMKMSREGRHHMLDNIADGPGYFGCLARVIAERMRRGWGTAYSVVRRPWQR